MHAPNEPTIDAVSRMARATLWYLEQGRSLDALENPNDNPQNFNSNRSSEF